MQDLWEIDGKVLAAVVEQIGVDRRNRADLDAVFGDLDLDEQRGNAAVRRLTDAGLVRAKGTFGGTWFVLGVTERDLREA